jgi:hypothetical protein
LRQVGTGHLVAAESARETSRGPGAVARHLWSFLTRRTLDTEALATERLSILWALPILSSDPLSSVAHGPEDGLSALAYAAAIAARVIAVQGGTRVNERAEESEHIVSRLLAWKRHARADGREDPIHLVVIESPYPQRRPSAAGLCRRLAAGASGASLYGGAPGGGGRPLVAHWLHNPPARWLKAAPLGRSTVAVADVTYHLIGEQSS